MPRNKKDASPKRKSAVQKKSKITRSLKPEAPTKSTSAAGKSRAEGIRLFKLAGRPTREEFQLVYGERGHLMTWTARAAAGVPATKFQAALAAKQSGRKDAKPSIPAPTAKD
ncbi:MAG: hypothetical protein WAK29_12930 [Terriglobales bacterium]